MILLLLLSFGFLIGFFVARKVDPQNVIKTNNIAEKAVNVLSSATNNVMDFISNREGDIRFVSPSQANITALVKGQTIHLAVNALMYDGTLTLKYYMDEKEIPTSIINIDTKNKAIINPPQKGTLIITDCEGITYRSSASTYINTEQIIKEFNNSKRKRKTIEGCD